MLSDGVEQSIRAEGVDISQVPNPLILAVAWGIVLLTLGLYFLFSTSNIFVRSIGIVLIASSVIAFMIGHHILRHGYATRKKYEEWILFDWENLRWPSLDDLGTLDREQRIGCIIAIIVVAFTAGLLIYVWLAYGF